MIKLSGRKEKHASLLYKACVILTVLLIPVQGVTGAALKPLFIQVHPTNPISNISQQDLMNLLAGRVLNFTQIGGTNEPIRFFVDPRIAESLKRSFPALKLEARAFDDEKVKSNRRFLGLSDLRGLRPFLKTVYIERTLPWGRIKRDRTLERPGPYPFVMDGAEAWEPRMHLSVVQTGVTAMTRMFIHAVEKSGDLLYPIRHTKKITEQADLAMTSNEVSFLEPCPFPLKNNLVFCSPKRYFTILLKSGFDVIEITGNHNNDFGARYNTGTIEMMEHAGMVYFGGGRNKRDAESVRYVTAKGTTIAFVGFNECGPEAAWATDTQPGAARLSRELFVRLIREAAKKADVVFVTVQWCNENNPVPEKKQIDYFHTAADLGATIIVSSSAHRPMGLEFYRGRFISYGLGNFLFDQMQSESHRSGLIARHHLYKGRHIATELIPYMIYDYSQPRIISGSRERRLMQEIFRYSIGPAFR
jgi:hypothetical protein